MFSVFFSSSSIIKHIRCVSRIEFLSMLKPSTHIDENRELTIEVSERQIRGQSFSSGLFFSAVLR